jgi:hypothetical protein
MSRKLDLKKLFFILPTITYFGNIRVSSKQNCLTLKSLQISFHADGMKLRGGVDKSLARPGRKQATATKLRIYSTQFLARGSNFCKQIKKKSEHCPKNQVSEAAMNSVSDEKW